jgi:hypothetical protein
MQIHDRQPERMEPLHLPGRAGVMDRILLSRVIQQYGADRMSAAVQIALTCTRLGLACRRKTDRVAAALLSCLPVECRLEFSLTTGLKFSARRPFRWMAVGNDRAERRRLEQQFGVTVVDLEAARPPRTFSTLHGWAGFVSFCIRHSRLSALEAELSQPHVGLQLQDLAELGDRCKHRL